MGEQDLNERARAASFLEGIRAMGKKERKRQAAKDAVPNRKPARERTGANRGRRPMSKRKGQWATYNS